MTKQMKPVKAWAYRDYHGKWCWETYKHSDYECHPVTITDSRWMTRAEFEAGEPEPTGCYIWGKSAKGPLLSFYVGIYIDAIDGRPFDSEVITHVQPIHAPSAPTEGE